MYYPKTDNFTYFIENLSKFLLCYYIIYDSIYYKLFSYILIFFKD